MVETRHNKTISIVSLIIIIFGFLILMLLESGVEAPGSNLILTSLGFFNTGLNIEITFLIVPAIVMLLLRTKSIKVETSLGITRVLSCLSFLIIVIYGVFVSIGSIVPRLESDPSFVEVMSFFILLFAIQAALHFIVFWMASKALAR